MTKYPIKSLFFLGCPVLFNRFGISVYIDFLGVGKQLYFKFVSLWIFLYICTPKKEAYFITCKMKDSRCLAIASLFFINTKQIDKLSE